jgi:hypothetical protein
MAGQRLQLLEQGPHLVVLPGQHDGHVAAELVRLRVVLVFGRWRWRWRFGGAPGGRVPHRAVGGHPGGDPAEDRFAGGRIVVRRVSQVLLGGQRAVGTARWGVASVGRPAGRDQVGLTRRYAELPSGGRVVDAAVEQLADLRSACHVCSCLQGRQSGAAIRSTITHRGTIKHRRENFWLARTGCYWRGLTSKRGPMSGASVRCSSVTRRWTAVRSCSRTRVRSRSRPLARATSSR